jgi:hypothetical protein
VKIILQDEISLHKKEKPGVFGSKGGWLFLTDDKLVFVKTGWRGAIRACYSEEELDKFYKEGKVGLEIPLSNIIEISSDTRLGNPYLTVRYRTEQGEDVCSLLHKSTAAQVILDYTPWVEAIYKRMKEIRKLEAPSIGEQKLERTLVIVDQSHDQEGQTRNMVIADAVNGICSKLGLDEPFALQGHPDDKLFIANQHLLPRTVLIILFGMKAGKFEQQELELIIDYVKNGGRLLLAAYSPYDPPNSFIEPFATKFLTPEIVDEISNDGKHKDHIIVKDFADHPLNAGVNAVCFGKYGCYPLGVSQNAVVLASSSNVADPPIAPVAVLVPYGNGHVLIIGQTRLFQDDFIKMSDNEKWLRNIINFLVSEQI